MQCGHPHSLSTNEHAERKDTKRAWQTCEVLVGEIEEEDKDNASVVGVDDACASVDHKLGG